MTTNHEEDETPQLTLAPLIVPQPSLGKAIEELEDRYRLYGVQYRHDLYTVDWSKELLDNGREKSYHEWIAAIWRGEWKLADAHLYLATMRHLYNNIAHAEQQQRQLVEQLRQVFKNDASSVMMTSTSVTLRARDDDGILHHYGYPEQQKMPGVVVGPGDFITVSRDKDITLNDLLETSNKDEIERVIEWVTSKKPYLWRPGSSSPYNQEGAILLHDNGYKFNLIIDWYYDLLARGVVVYSPSGANLNKMTNGL